MIGSEWIKTHLPPSWRIARVRDHASIMNGYPFDSELFTADNGIPLVRIRDIANDKAGLGYAGNLVPEALIHSGDILVGMDGNFNVTRWRGGDALLNQRVCCIRPTDAVDAGFLYYVLPAPLNLINEFTYSTTVKHLSSFDVLNIHFPYPSLSLQRIIAGYLDRETARLDALVAAKERVLGLLAEKRRALVTRAVTRGLDPSVLLRDSGIPWLGAIPAHWETERARWLFRERDERSDTGEGELLTVSHLTGVTPRSEKDVNMFEAETTEGYKICLSGDLVINTLWAWMGAMGVSPMDGIVSPAYNVYEPVARFHPSYVDALVRLSVFAQEVTRYSKGVWSSRLRLYPESFFAVSLPVPPASEQREIIAYIARETSKLDELQVATERTTSLLTERREALIAAAVTGQLEVM